MIGYSRPGLGKSQGTGSLLPQQGRETPLVERLRTYRLGAAGQRAQVLAIEQLRNQLRQAELKPELFMDLQSGILQLMYEPQTMEMYPLDRIRDIVQGIMTAFMEKKMDQSEGARVATSSVVLFFPRGRVEQFDVARYVACELILTKVNLGTEMVQISFGVGKAFTSLLGLASLLPKVLNSEAAYLEQLYEHLYKGIWMGTMLVTSDSKQHGDANVAKFEQGHEVYAQELIQRTATTKTQALLSGLFGK